MLYMHESQTSPCIFRQLDHPTSGKLQYSMYLRPLSDLSRLLLQSPLASSSTIIFQIPFYFEFSKGAKGCTFSSPLSSSHGVERDQQWLPGEVARMLVHYGTSRILPQQKKVEINLTLEVLFVRSPCNFLVFDLGYDSPFWNALNSHGKTVFLEEDSNWIQKVMESQPGIEAYHIQYQIKMSMVDALLHNYRRNGSSCSPTRALRSSKCEFALTNLPMLIHETEWDMIMIDAPRGYFDAAPERMSAIFTAAVMASNRKKEGSTDFFLHDVDRRVEQMYVGEFLCSSNLVGYFGRLWHFRVPPFSRMKPTSGSTDGFFCMSPMSNMVAVFTHHGISDRQLGMENNKA